MNRNRKPIRLTESQLHRIVEESVKSVLLEQWDEAAFENACDDLYYGYGFGFWRKQHDYLDPITADEIWNAAFRKMSEDYDAEFIPHSIESYDSQRAKNYANSKAGINGRYPHENLNVIDNGENGKLSLYAQGGLNQKLNGIRAIKQGGLWLGAAKDEWEKNASTINRSKSAQNAFKQGRIGNERPLHRKGSLNRAFDED